jgi:hypothetical protein
LTVHGTDRPEEELNHTGPEVDPVHKERWAGRTDPEHEEAGNHHKLRQWEEEAMNTGFEEVQNAEAYPTESDR